MPDTSPKTLVYFRARWDQTSIGAAKPSKVLQTYLESAHRKVPRVDDRAFDYGVQQVKGLMATGNGAKGHFVHIASYTENQTASTVPKRTTKPVGELGEANPPQNEEFMDGDLFALVHGNDLILCMTRLRERAFVHYCSQLFTKAGIAGAVGPWQVGPVANVNKLKMLQEHGARSISLNVGVFGATLDYEERKSTHMKALRGGILDTIRDYLKAEEETKDIAAKEDLQVQLVLSFNTKKRKNISGKEELIEMAKELVGSGDEESYEIDTPGGKIRSTEMKQTDRVAIPTQGKSVQAMAALQEMEKFYQQLKEEGLLEQ